MSWARRPPMQGHRPGRTGPGSAHPERRPGRPTGAFAGESTILDRLAFALQRPMTRRFQAFTLQQASEESPTLAGLMARARDGQMRLQAILPLLPAEMRPALQAGPSEEGSWCILVKGNAVAAKLRQMSPMLLARLRTKGWEVTAIRIKVQGRS